MTSSRNIAVAATFALFTAVGGYFVWKAMQPPPIEHIWCAGGTQTCPDGSRVFRLPPDCDFEACPDQLAPGFAPPPASPATVVDTARFTIPADAFATAVQPFDFNHDGQTEYIVYYRQNVTFNGKATEKQYLKIYRMDATGAWVVDHEDEGSSYGNVSIPSYPVTFPNIDTDVDQEARVTKEIDGTGGYSQSYFLVWDGAKVKELFLPAQMEVIAANNLESFLHAGESFGSMDFRVPSSSISICDKNNGFCTSRESAANAIGTIQFDAIYVNGAWQLTNFVRVDY